MSPHVKKYINDLQQTLSKIINISWLSVYRDTPNIEDGEYHTARELREINTIDQKLIELIRKLTIYQLQLESESNRLSNRFREQVFEARLYEKEFDELSLNNFKSVDPEQIKTQLNKAYKDLGLSTRHTQNKITLHADKIGLASKKIEQWQKSPDKPISVNDVTPLSLLNRTLKIISVSSEIETQKKEVFKPIESYLRILKEFVADKTFKLDTESSGELRIFINQNNNQIFLPIKYLSSGEKQLIILLTETLLQKKSNYIFIADEPELSLHISWQRKIISAIKELNENAQLIVATHSPEIASQWRDKIINMGNILHEGK
jgi:predicted ATP-dependent endonuclease of OLD family